MIIWWLFIELFHDSLIGSLIIIWSLFDDLIDYLTSNNQQIIQTLHSLFDDYLICLIDYLIDY